MPDYTQLLSNTAFPRSAGYDVEWILDNQMGPHPLWLLEWLLEVFPLEAGMRILDLGCGRAITSIFLAREINVQVWAADLWITPDPNLRRATAAGVGDQVFPLRAEAHALPFPEEFFDAIVSIDAYHYFGTDVHYLGYATRFLKPGGRIGVVVPGLMQPFTEAPEHLVRPQSNGHRFWEDECRSFKTPGWWKEHWDLDANVTGVHVDILEDGWRLWRDFERALEIAGKAIFPSVAEALDADAGRYLGFIRAAATRTERDRINLYDPNLGRIAGVDDDASDERK